MKINKKRKIIIFTIVILLISSVVTFCLINSYKFSSKPIFDFPPLKENEKLDSDDYVYDFNYAWDVLEKYYPYFDVNRELFGVDFSENKNDYQDYIAQAKTDEDFYKRFNQILKDLHNYHVNLIGVNEGIYQYLTYRDAHRVDFRSDFADLYENSIVQNRYGITNELIRDKLSEYHGQDFEILSTNANCQDLIPGKIALISIPNMIGYDLQSIEFKKDKEKIESYLQLVENYGALVIDIRGNGGGDSQYWEEFLLPLIVSVEVRNLEYTFIKAGPLFKKVRRYEGYKRLNANTLRSFGFPEKTINYLKDFSFYTNHERVVNPNNESVKFGGKIYLLVDEKVFSSAEMLASFMKETNIATLIGTTTGGDGIGTDPFQISLPKSGFVMRFPKQMGVTGKGSINDLEKTKPDITVIDSSVKYSFGENQININTDKCLEKVLELEKTK